MSTINRMAFDEIGVLDDYALEQELMRISSLESKDWIDYDRLRMIREELRAREG